MVKTKVGSKAAGAKSKSADDASKTVGSGSKTVGSGSKTSEGGSKASGGGSKTAKGASTIAGDDVQAVARASTFDVVELPVPVRVGRTVDNLDVALEEVEVRLRVGEFYREALESALPDRAKFFSVAWSAMRVLRTAARSAGDGVEAKELREQALEVASVVRTIVTKLTAVGDPARAKVLVGEKVEAKVARSAEQCREILTGAKELQARFPALTDELVKELEVAVEAAERATESRGSERTGAEVDRLSKADLRQRALDVLLDCMDQLAAAALSTLRKSNPKVVERLSRALEPDSSGKGSGGGGGGGGGGPTPGG